MFKNLDKETALKPLPPFLAPLREQDRNLSIIIVVSLVLTIFGTFQLLVSPPTDADAYEYAGVARSFLETGRFEHQLLPAPGYLSTNRNVPQPAIDRFTLWTLVMIPMQAMLGDSVWVFLIPLMLSFFFLGPLAYLFAVSLFDRRTAFFAALSVMLLPRFFYIAFIEDAGQPNFLYLDLMLVVLSMALRGRWLTAGLFASLMMATRYTGIVALVAVFVWICLTDRKQFLRWRFWAFFLLATMIIGLFIVRASKLSEWGLGMLPKSFILTADLNLMEDIHEIGMLTHVEYKRKPPTADPTTPIWKRRAKVIAHNFGIVFVYGFNSKISSYPGFPLIVTLSLLPFTLLGSLFYFQNRRCLLPLLVVLIGLTAFSLRISYEDRYLFPMAAMSVMLAFHGALVCGQRFRLITPRRLFLVFLLLEAGPALILNSMRLVKSDSWGEYDELSKISDWTSRNIPEDATLLTVPFWSPHYLMRRKTALLPMGDLLDFRDAAQEYKADYMLFQWFWPGDQPPRLPFLTPLLRGQRHILYHINRNHPAFLDPDGMIPYLADFDWLGYFWKNRFTLNNNNSFYKTIEIVTHSPLLGWTLFIVSWLGILLMPNPMRRWPWIIILLLIPFIVTSLKIHAMIIQITPLMVTTPHFSLIQAERFIASRSKTEAVHSIRLALDDPAAIEKWRGDWEKIGVAVSLEPYVPGQPPTRGEAVFLEVAIPPQPTGHQWYARDAHEAENLHEKYLQQIAFGLKQAGYRVEILDAGVLGVPAEPATQ
ncbi:MAG TPA: glycosyltransferase family 39 protein [bacterium]|nr:glycosyltransferase family 39 protein [bacterium]